MVEIVYKEESYKIVGICMEVHRDLGMGFKEAVYKDTLGGENEPMELPLKHRNTEEFSCVSVPLWHLAILN